MDRINFLKRFLTSGLLLTLPRIVDASIQKGKPEHWNEILIYTENVAGFGFYKGAQLMSDMKLDDALDLVREPDNPYDHNAIAVYWQGEKIGFMPRIDNLILAAILDAKLPCEAFISGIYPEADTWNKLQFSINLLYPMDYLAKEKMV